MKSRMFLAAVIVSALVAVPALWAADKAPGKDVKCPVSGKAVNPDATVDYQGGKVYFCCENCPKAFAKDTAKFSAKANHQMVQTGQLVQVACPISGKPTNEGTELDVAGVKVSFCCMNCKGKVAKATGDDQIKEAFSDANIKKGYKLAKDKK